MNNLTRIRIVLAGINSISILVSIDFYDNTTRGQTSTTEDLRKQNCEIGIRGTYIDGKRMIDKESLALRQQLEDSIIQLQAKQQS
jgi:hypothetical protein